MSGAITPPSPGDVLHAAAALGWPAFNRGELAIAEGEEAWRAAMTPDLAARVWASWHEPDAEDDRDDDALEGDPEAEGGEP
jgi:hypothetical protein